MKILVAIPTYDGKLPVQVVNSLMIEQSFALSVGDELLTLFLSNCSNPAFGRNQIAQEFLSSDADKLFFLDSDVTWEAGSIVKLCHQPFDYVGGAYRFKIQTEDYPVSWIGGDLYANKEGLLEVAVLPGGFTALTRKVFDTVREKYPGREYNHLGKTSYCYFQHPFAFGGLNSEESHFCSEWRQAGGKVYLDPELELTHWDFNAQPYPGHIGNWLKSKITKERSHGD